MPWFKVDDAFHSHPKVMELSVEAVGLWTLAGTWCANYLTDGVIRESVLHRFGRTSANVRELCAELVASGLWIDNRDGTYQYKDWDDYQPIKADVEADREAARERMRQVRAKKRAPKRSENVQPNINRTSEEVRVTPTQPDPTESSKEDSPSSHVASDDDGKSNEVEVEQFFSEEVIELCDHLASLIRSNGNKVGKVGVTWWKAMERLIRIDDYTPDQVRQVIDWSQQDEFWQGNIRSAPKLREKFDQLKTRMFSERAKQSRQPAYMTATERKMAVGAERAQRFAQHQADQQGDQRRGILNIIQGEVEA